MALLDLIIWPHRAQKKKKKREEEVSLVKDKQIWKKY
jgi:hypothetical protein